MLNHSSFSQMVLKIDFLGRIDINVWEAHFTLVELNFSMMVIHNVVSVVRVVGDTIAHIFYILGAEYVVNFILVQPSLYG